MNGTGATRLSIVALPKGMHWTAVVFVIEWGSAIAPN
jgi:hypothetical protein